MDRNKDHLSPSGGEHPEGHHGGTSGDRPHYGSQKDRREKRDHEKRDIKKNSCSGPDRRRDHGILQQSFRTGDRYRSDHRIYDDHAL